jgi:hypothetical protein
MSISVDSWYFPTAVGTDQWGYWSIGLVGKPGADGAGYEYVYPFNLSSGSPGMPGDPGDGSPFYANSTISIPALGAYRVGNSVRYYPNPDIDPTAWVEGQITSTYFSTIDWITISLNNGTPSAAGMYGVDGSNYTIAPYMTLIGEKGDTKILQSLISSDTSYSLYVASSPANNTTSVFSTAESTIMTLNKVSDTSAIELEFTVSAEFSTSAPGIRSYAIVDLYRSPGTVFDAGNAIFVSTQQIFNKNNNQYLTYYGSDYANLVSAEYNKVEKAIKFIDFGVGSQAIPTGPYSYAVRFTCFITGGTATGTQTVIISPANNWLVRASEIEMDMVTIEEAPAT